MSNSANGEFQQTARDSVALLHSDITAYRESAGRNFTPTGYLLNLMEQTDKGDLMVMQYAVRAISLS